jgi:hypothetical protein
MNSGFPVIGCKAFGVIVGHALSQFKVFFAQGVNSYVCSGRQGVPRR